MTSDTITRRTRIKRLAGGGIGGIGMKSLAMRRFEGKISMRYNRFLSKPRNLILRLENKTEVREYRCSGLKLENVNYEVKYGDGSSTLCNGRSEVCAKMIARVTLTKDSYIRGTFYRLE
jgi:hypothetical protein|tara:strand:+ start:8167 stop:8523 length:357 start_codon:yes stop_codon:yes gene_type:complete